MPCATCARRLFCSLVYPLFCATVLNRPSITQVVLQVPRSRSRYTYLQLTVELNHIRCSPGSSCQRRALGLSTLCARLLSHPVILPFPPLLSYPYLARPRHWWRSHTYLVLALRVVCGLLCSALSLHLPHGGLRLGHRRPPSTT